jgi:nucleoside-diphosphate-sugar epimerase
MNKIIDDDISEILTSNLPWNQLKGKTVLITGATGMLGSYCVRVVLGVGAKVVGLVRNENKALAMFSDIDEGFQVVIADISKPIEIETPVDYIIHTASSVTRDEWNNNPASVLEANSISTYHLLNFARDKKVEKFVYTSSNAALNKPSIDEPTDIYSESKIFSEFLCYNYSKQYNLDISTVRPPVIYGPLNGVETKNLIPVFIDNILQNHHIELQTDGLTLRQSVYISDVTLAAFTVLLNGKPRTAYNVTTSDSVQSIKAIAEAVIKEFESKGIEASLSTNDANKSNVINIDDFDGKPLESIGFKPQVTFQEGISRTVSYVLKT